MLSKVKKNNNEGFTIIEVMIVLAIAALILLIVFLAVPALQRNSRNTSRKGDIGRISSAINEYSSNHNGAALVAADSQEVIDSAGNLSQYTPVPAAAIGANSFTVVVAPAAGTAALTGGAANVNLGSIQVVTGGTCDTAVVGKVVQSSSTRRTAIQYLVEKGGGAVTPQCIDVQ